MLVSYRLSVSLILFGLFAVGLIGASKAYGQITDTPPTLPVNQSNMPAPSVSPASNSGATSGQSLFDVSPANGLQSAESVTPSSPDTFSGSVVTATPQPSTMASFNANPALDSGQPTSSPVSGGLSCLPMQVKTTDTVMENMQLTQKTVASALQERNAQCTQDGYQNASGKRIQFYTLGGCYNYSSASLTKLAQDADAQIQKLEREKGYDIIETVCNRNELP